MRTKLLAIMATGALSAAAMATFVATSVGAAQADQVIICHRTNAPNNAYNQIGVSENAIDGVGGSDHFGEHAGPLATSEAQAQSLKDQKIEWGDIIPPLDGVHSGANWSAAGQAIRQNGCNFLPTPPSSTSPPATTTPTPPGKIRLCHRTNAPNNAYNLIEVDESAADGVGGGDHFGEHKGPLATSEANAQSLKDQGIMWGDIIPPLAGVHNGLNWPAGQTIFNNGCAFAPGPPVTTSPPPTTSGPAPPTTKAPAPPTTKAPAPPTTKAPAPPTTKAPAPPTTKAPTPPTSTTPPGVVTVVPPPAAPLAFTGSDSGRIAIVAFIMTVLGIVLVSMNRRSTRLLAVAATDETATAMPPETGAEEPPLSALWVQAHEAIDVLNKWLASSRHEED